MNRTLLALCFATLPACSAFHSHTDPLRFIARPIELKDLGMGICTGDRVAIFNDRRGERFQITIVQPRIRLGEPPPKETSRSVVSVVHRGATTHTTDGDYLQRQLLRMLSESAQKLKTKRHLFEDEGWQLRVLNLLIADLQGRHAPWKPK